MTTGISFSSGIAIALDGLRQSERTTNAAIRVAAEGSLDPDVLAQAAAVLLGSQTSGSASALALEAGLAQQRRFIDILA